MSKKQTDPKRQDAPENPSDREKMIREATRIAIDSHREALKELARH